MTIQRTVQCFTYLGFDDIHNAPPWLLTNSGLFRKNFANYQLGGPIDNLRSFFKMLLNLPDT